jgi:CRISPR-associated protein Csx10
MQVARPLHVIGSDVVPVSALLCKYPADDGCRAAAVDAAFESATKCPACGGSAEPGKGQVILPAGVTVERVTRTSIDRNTGMAADGELYAHAALPAGTILAGLIHGRHSWLEEPRTLRLGGRRTVGAAAEFSAEPGAPDPLDAHALAGGSLTIRLTGPAIFADAAGRPSLDPDPGLDLAGCQVERRWTRAELWEGWHAASRLPKPRELCASAGSTYRISGPAGTLRRLAERLISDGIGLRRAEGFGQMHVVTQPWRPTPPREQEAGRAAGYETLRNRHAGVGALGLDTSQLQWLVAALRGAQLARQQAPGEPRAAAELAREIMTRPAAEQFSGRQRDHLAGLLAEPDSQLLRDLTTMLLASLPAATPAGPETR